MPKFIAFIASALFCALFSLFGLSDPAAAAPGPELAASTVLTYEGSGQERGFFNYSGSGTLEWIVSGDTYQSSLSVFALGFRVRQWHSSGTIGPTGLAPLRFDDTPRGAQWNTRFLRDPGVISFSAGTPDIAMKAGAQDKLSALLQLGVALAGEVTLRSADATVGFQAADAHGTEDWTFKTGATETLKLPGGSVQAIKMTKSANPASEQTIEIWLAPALGYLPARLRITESNGSFMDLMWLKSQKPG